MKRVKVIYWILTGLFAIITVGLAYYLYTKEKDWASLFLSGVAVVLAILAIGLSDKKLPQFYGYVSLWTNKPNDTLKYKKRIHSKGDELKTNDKPIKGEEQEEAEEEEVDKSKELEYKMSIRIVNKDEDPVNDIKIKIRTPHRIFEKYPEKNAGLRQIFHGRTSIFFDDQFGILGNELNEEYLHYDLKANLDSWVNKNQGFVYITINGSNIQTTTYILKCEMVTKLKVATENNSMKLDKLKKQCLLKRIFASK